MGRFEIKDDFYLDDVPFKIVSGAIHYFRIVPEYWKDRLKKCKAMGCNTVETYIPWNLHESKKNEFCFEGRLDVVKFIQIAQEVGLYVIIRPSPYICAEWEFGGLPAWLLKEDHPRLRADDETFLEQVNAYYKELFPRITPYQVECGGPIILMQVENEYGYYANDVEYLEKIRDMMLELKVTVPLVTSDGPFMESLLAGTIKHVLPTGNFGSRTKERFEMLEKFTNEGPLMCTEFWVGWFDHWGNGKHMTSNLEENCRDFNQMLQMGSANIYMFAGGTNFGFMNGSNYYDQLTPDVTSYDYDAVLTEDGRITNKYREFQKIIGKYLPIEQVELEKEVKRIEYGTIKVDEKVSLQSTLFSISQPIESKQTMSMEKLDQNYGYILYRTVLNTEISLQKLKLWKANDRAQVFLENSPLAILYDRELLEEIELDEKETQGKTLDILVENMGRVNFGPRMEQQRKGIDQCVQINGHIHQCWSHFSLPLDQTDKIDFSKEYIKGLPGFYRFIFEVDEIGDTFLDVNSWGKGCAFINGFHLGRFWEIGPQKRLYLPGPLLKMGTNEIILFETDGMVSESIQLVSEPDLG